jgi:predicted acetyltransferase
MSLNVTWVGEAELDRVAETRVLCYAHSRKDLAEWRKYIHNQGRSRPGDYLLAERDGKAVGTATSLRLNMWIRGSAVSCQGVAHVGTIKTERRRGAGREDGVGSIVMREVLRMGREREHVLSALMPWRASYYEHFGYGLVERRAEWMVPLSLMPTEECAGLRFMSDGDKAAMDEARNRMIARGQGDIEKSKSHWDDYFVRKATDGFIVVDPKPEGGLRGWMLYKQETLAGKERVRVLDLVYDSSEALRRQLSFLGSLRDQYSTAMLILPVDLPLNLLLKETQVPHRPVTHAVAEVGVHTRMQVRVLDHARLISAMHLQPNRKGSAIVEVRETEGFASKFRIDLEAGKASAKPTEASPDLVCTDRIWASIVMGELPIAKAAELKLAEVNRLNAIGALSAFSDGPVPFCSDGF